MELTIGILSFNTKDLLRKCLSSIYKYTDGIRYEVIVVDNASHDGSAQMIEKEFPKVKLCMNKKNKYFAEGYNQIIKIAKGKYFIMLNSDTYLKNNAFKKILGFMKEKDLNACEGLEIKPNGKIIPTGTQFRTILSDFYSLSMLGKIFRNESYLKKNKMKNKNRKNNFEIKVGCNAYFCIETKLLKDIGGYDENFTLYYTEDDLSQRIYEKGYKIFHCGDSYVIHEDAKSTMQLGWKRLDLFYDDLFVYHQKYNSKFMALALFWLLTGEKKLLELRAKINGGMP